MPENGELAYEGSAESSVVSTLWCCSASVFRFAEGLDAVDVDMMDEPISRCQLARLYDLVRKQRDALDFYAASRGW